MALILGDILVHENTKSSAWHVKISIHITVYRKELKALDINNKDLFFLFYRLNC